jgi:alginate O-acetyltransferase complex protein AlgI
MLFNSYPFLFVYLPITFLGTFLIGAYSHRLAILWLGSASVVFYGFWNITFVSLLLGSIIINFEFGRRLSSAYQKKTSSNRILALAIAANLLVLGYFKYCNFFIGSFAQLFGAEFAPFNIILPLGISFFTFTQIGFLIDVSRGLTSEASLSRYLLFVTYFPHLIAGPLLHHKDMMPQFADRGTFNFNIKNISIGLTIFVLALAKKIFLADSFSEIADPIFSAVEQGRQPLFFEAWIGALSYALQLYFDFSAYSEMAIGLSLIFNIRLPLNFNSPFKATCVIEFWQRWHMSLTKYIYEYLYSPITLKFMRLGLGKSTLIENLYTILIPTFITFLIIGLWHGAAWTFVTFGALHGTYMVINYGWQAVKKKMRWKPTGLFYSLFCCALTYCCVVSALVFFRADSMSAALSILTGMVGLNGLSLPVTLQPFLNALPFNLSKFTLVFDGLIPLSSFTPNPLVAVFLLVIGHAIVWLMPNMPQIMSSYEIALGYIVQTKKRLLDERQWMFRHALWRLTSFRAFSLGLLFFLIVIAMATDKPSTFLYYQF